MRWWHVLLFYTVLLGAVTGVSHAMKPSSSPGAVSTPSLPSVSTTSTSTSVSAPPTITGSPSAASSSRTPRLGGQHATGRPAGRLILAAHGVVLPDLHATPGAINLAVTQANIHSTICVTGFTSTIRPVSSYTTALKQRQLAAGYSFRGDTDTADYEEDHLIALELGGSPRSVRNLWPQPYAAGEGARVKDSIENTLHSLVCDGTISLDAAQAAIAGNWWHAYQHYAYSPSTPTTHAPAPTRTHTPTPTYTPPPPVTSAAAPAQHSCTTTSSGSCIRGGEFCPQAAYGSTGYDVDGDTYTCTGDSTHPHWE